MSKQMKKYISIAAGIIAIALIILIVVLIKKYTPSKTHMKLDKYFEAKSGQAVLILQDEISEERGLYEGGHVYVSVDLVKEKFNSRFYWDSTENLLLYTTSSKVFKAEPSAKEYTQNKSVVEVDYPIVKADENGAYVALDYVEEFSPIEYEVYEDPVRVVINYKFDKDVMYASVKKDTQLRYKADIKSSILVDLKKEEKLLLLDTSTKQESKFVKAMTESGVIGYVKKKRLNDGEYVKLSTDFKKEEYSHINIGETVNLVWHQVTNTDANETLLNLLDQTKGVNVIAPTWFSVSSNSGTITSLASETYVERAHNAGVQVWALCDDFNSEVSMAKLLSATSTREKLEKELIAVAIKYNIDGINIDFENITSDAGEDFIQFVRELSIKCRNNEIILSIDNYPPTEYTAYYNRAEQGAVADYVITMAYDEHYAASEESGSVSSISYVEDSVNNTIAEVDASRVIIAMPFYTRLWKETKKKVTSESYSMISSWNLVSDNHVDPVWDKETKQYYAEWKDGNTKCRIWLEDEESLDAKLKAAKAGKVAGYAFWKLGLERSTVWDTVVKYTN